MIMSSEGLDRNVLFPPVMVNTRHPERRCLNARGSLAMSEKERVRLVMMSRGEE